jgi:hypothetical protein
MSRKFFLTAVMSMILFGAAASNTAKPVLMAMGVLSLFVIFVAANRNETKDEKP